MFPPVLRWGEFPAVSKGLDQKTVEELSAAPVPLQKRCCLALKQKQGDWILSLFRWMKQTVFWILRALVVPRVRGGLLPLEKWEQPPGWTQQIRCRPVPPVETLYLSLIHI